MSVRILHGDCIDVMRTLDADTFDVCITDPPYNVGKDYGGHDDEVPIHEYVEWLGARLGQAFRVSRLGIVYFPGKRWALRSSEVLAVAGIDPDSAALLGWHKTEFAGDKFKQRGPAQCWEPIVWAPKGNAESNDVYGTIGRDFLVVKSHRQETTPLKALHPCPKPTEVMSWLVGLFCPPGGHVLDPFGGSGTTGLVAQRLGRSATLIELNPAYVKIAEARIRGDAPLFSAVVASRDGGSEALTT